MTDFNLFKHEMAIKISQADNIADLDQLKNAIFSKSGPLQVQMAKIVTMSAELKKQFGGELNLVKQELQQAFELRKQQLGQILIQNKLATEWQDLSLNKAQTAVGKLHPLTQVQNEMLEIFANFGFAIKDGPSIEDEWHNFAALNIDENHPARQMHDTFYLKNGNNTEYLLRTHTSPVQIRTMQGNKPPFKFIAPGRVYRCDWDITHTPMFHQLEGVVVDKNIHMGHLKHFINEFMQYFFECNDLEARFRASFFPFTEPSAEVDIKYTRKANELILGKGDDWLEVMGCGMIHPAVLAGVGIDANEYQGFAFGLGIERFAMLKYGITDLREFFTGDLRWLSHYGFSAFDLPSVLRGLSK